MMTTTRCDAAQRKASAAATRAIYSSYKLLQTGEPALGSLEDRLNTVIRRLGGRTSALPRLSPSERAQFMVPAFEDLAVAA